METRAAPASDHDDSASRTTSRKASDIKILMKYIKSNGTCNLTHTMTVKTRFGNSTKYISSCGYIDETAARYEMPLFQHAIAKDNAKYWISPVIRTTPALESQIIEKYGTVEDLEVESERANKKSRTSPPPPPPPPPVEESKSDNTKKRKKGRPANKPSNRQFVNNPMSPDVECIPQGHLNLRDFTREIARSLYELTSKVEMVFWVLASLMVLLCITNGTAVQH